MNKNYLGKTNIKVSPLCFGTLTMTPMQSNLPIDKGAELLVEAFERGVNFCDTAEYYENYEYIKKALKTIPRDEYIIATKSYAYDNITAEKALKEALDEIETDYIDIFLLHEQESEHTLRGHYEALEYFNSMKEKGYIRATGISTHRIAAVKAAIEDELIEIIHPIINIEGIGIGDGSRDQMEDVLIKAHKKGIGIYGMKALGGGHLISSYVDAMKYVLSRDYLDSIAMGMQSVDEIICNTSMINKERNLELEKKLIKKDRKLQIEDYCIGCGACVERCGQNAIKIIDGQAVPQEGCILCGYCAKVCPDFCIKVV